MSPDCTWTEWRRGWDSNPRYGFPHARFRGECFQPLSHLSAVGNFKISRPLREAATALHQSVAPATGGAKLLETSKTRQKGSSRCENQRRAVKNFCRMPAHCSARIPGVTAT